MSKIGFKVGKRFNNIITKCSKIVRFVRKSTVASEKLEKERRIQAATETRWNSQLKMIRSILAIPNSKLVELETPHKLTTYERNVLQEMIMILTPFEEATDYVQIEKYPSAGYVLPCIKGLRSQLTAISSIHHATFLKELQNSIDRRLAVYEKDVSYCLAAVCDPRFKTRWCTSSDEEKRMKQMLIQRMQSVKPSVISSQSDGNKTSGKSVESDEPPAKKAKKQLFSFMEVNKQDSKKNDDDNEEMNRYLQGPCLPMETNPLQYWTDEKCFPKVSKVAEVVLAIPASSAAVERLFSVAGKIYRPERCRLSDNKFEQLMFIKCNSNIVD